MAAKPLNTSIPHAAARVALQSVVASVVLVCLTPIYGSIPTFENIVNRPWQWAIHIAGLSFITPSSLSNEKALRRVLGMLVAGMPLLFQFVLFPSDSWLGPEEGPLHMQTWTINYLIAYGCAVLVHSIGTNVSFPSWFPFQRASKRIWRFLLVRCLCGAVIPLLGRSILVMLGWQASLGYYFISRLGLLRLSVGVYLAVENVILQDNFISKHAFAGFVLLYATVFVLTSGLGFGTGALERNGFRLLDRIDSTTGYISVLQNDNDSFRVMRNDHSLLGGVWLPDGDRLVPESVYPVFCMLEAVRLIECDSCTPRSAEEALVIGLGIGTAPAALAAHAVSTTVVEIDPAVANFAEDYFEFPKKAVAVINQDAFDYVRVAFENRTKYDYIIHDVFTGGAEPVKLFTYEFLTQLRNLLKPTGVIAINYAGDLRQESTLRILKTICSVFLGCRAYRDSEDRKPGGSPHEDIVNMVVFAQAVGAEWSFREATDHDFLGSQVRRNALPPRYEINMDNVGSGSKNVEVVRLQDVPGFSKGQFESACAHWKIMRKVLPAAVWTHY